MNCTRIHTSAVKIGSLNAFYERKGCAWHFFLYYLCRKCRISGKQGYRIGHNVTDFPDGGYMNISAKSACSGVTEHNQFGSCQGETMLLIRRCFGWGVLLALAAVLSVKVAHAQAEPQKGTPKVQDKAPPAEKEMGERKYDIKFQGASGTRSSTGSRTFPASLSLGRICPRAPSTSFPRV